MNWKWLSDSEVAKVERSMAHPGKKGCVNNVMRSRQTETKES